MPETERTPMQRDLDRLAAAMREADRAMGECIRQHMPAIRVAAEASARAVAASIAQMREALARMPEAAR